MKVATLAYWLHAVFHELLARQRNLSRALRPVGASLAGTMSTPENGVGEAFASPPPRSSRHRYSLIISTNARSDPGVKQRSGVDNRACARSVFRTAIIWREPSLTSTIR